MQREPRPCSRVGSTTPPRWYRRARASAPSRGAAADRARCEVLALAYAGDPTADEQAAALLAEVGDDVDPHAAYAWYCAGEADLAVDPDRARARFARALELAERDERVLRERGGRARRRPRSRPASAIPRSPPRSTGACSPTGAGPACGRPSGRCCARSPCCSSGSGATGTRRCSSGRCGRTGRGHRIFGADEATLAELGERLRRRARATSATRPPSPRGRRARRRRCRRACAPRRSDPRSPAGLLGEDAEHALPTSSWVRASLPGWNPPQRTSR